MLRPNRQAARQAPLYSRSMADLQRAEALLNPAVERNHAGAREWLDTVAEPKRRAERRIARGPAMN